MLTTFGIIFVNILLIEAKNLGNSRFLTDTDFKNSEKLSVEEIDKGIGFVNEKAEFNPKFFGGDIVHKPSKKRKDIHGYITKSSGRHWPNGRVPYEFDSDFTAKERAHIATAFSFFHNKTCIRFVNREPTDKSYVKIVKEDGCFSDYLGRHRKSSQNVSLSEECMRVDIIIHELMHSIGFMHEFSRPDRDKYIDINYENLDPKLDAKDQFNKMSGEMFGDWNLTFDTKSAMFYESDLGAKTPNMKVMKAKNGEELRCKPHLCPTELDAIKINTVYNCPNYSSKPSVLENVLLNNNKLSSNTTHSCSSLRWKTRKHFEETDNPVISRKTIDKNHFICRALLFNGEFKSGETNSDNSECIITSDGFWFSWDFIDYEILVNPKNKTIEWQTLNDELKESYLNSERNDLMLVFKKNGYNFYVTKCTKSKLLLKHFKFCSIKEVLKC